MSCPPVETVTLEPVPIEDKAVVRNLMELCQHDYSEVLQHDVNTHGLFGYPYLDHFWTEPGRHAFFVRADGTLAGFALIRTLEGDEGEPVLDLTEFFVLRKYRRLGIGRQAAEAVFDRLPGRWRVASLPGSATALTFWRDTVARYTGGPFEEEDDAEWGGPVLFFTAPARR